MNLIKAIIFDIDGVLIPGDKWHQVAFIRAMSKFNIKISDSFYESKLGSLPTKDKLAIIAKFIKFDNSLIKKISAEKQKQTQGILDKELKQSMRLVRLFKRLKADGYEIACCSNSVRPTVVRVLKELGLWSEISFYLCAEDCKPKPSPEIYLKATRKLKCSPQEVLILEDSKEGIISAKSSGGHVMIIKSLKETNYKNIIRNISKIRN